jgi:hypothetical protein
VMCHSPPNWQIMAAMICMTGGGVAAAVVATGFDSGGKASLPHCIPLRCCHGHPPCWDAGEWEVWAVGDNDNSDDSKDRRMLMTSPALDRVAHCWQGGQERRQPPPRHCNALIINHY